VIRVEALGSETYLSVTLAGEILQARIPPDQAVALGETVWLAIAPDKVHLFDPETGVSLRN
jgi:multiple sugar transport system ATP-binding protein